MRDWESALGDRLLHDVAEPPPEGASAAVALVLREQHELEVLLIQRVERVGDPWSGQIALPGGMHGATDRNLADTARRETLEEVTLDVVETCAWIGRLPEVRPRNVPTLAVFPFVYALHQDAPVRTGDEVEAVFWAPLGQIRESEAVTSVTVRGHQLKAPAFHLEARVIWGLTHRILTDFFALGVVP